MVRDSRRMALYEVISRNGLKSPKNKELSRLRPVEPHPKPPVDFVPVKVDIPAESKVRPWPNRPKWLRFYNNKIEFSLSWQVVAIAVLAIFAIFLVFFRLGQMTAGTTAEKGVSTVKAVKPAVVAAAPVVKAEAKPLARPETPKMVEPMGDNVIAITSYHLVSHLEPVKNYFAGFGIETEIIQQNGRYLLITTQRYDNPEKVGTDGYKAKQKIIEIGARYKPPQGSSYESFAPKLFSDAYGMKVKQ